MSSCLQCDESIQDYQVGDMYCKEKEEFVNGSTDCNKDSSILPENSKEYLNRRFCSVS